MKTQPTKKSKSNTKSKIEVDMEADYNIIDGVIHLTPEQVTDSGGISKASEWASKSTLTSVVKIPFGTHKIDYHIELFNNTELTATRGTKLIFTPTDEKKACISFNRQSRFYAENIWVNGFIIEVTKAAYAAIQTNRSLETHLENIEIDNPDLLQYGIIIGGEGQENSGAIGSFLNWNKIKKCTSAGIYFQNCGGKHIIENHQLRFNQVGIKSDRSKIIIRDSKMDANKGHHILIHSATGITVDGTTFEGSSIKLTDTETFMLIDSKNSNGEFIFDNVNYSKFEVSRLNKSAKISGADKIKMNGCYVQPPEDYEKLIEDYCDEDNVFTNNFTGRGVDLKDDNC